MREGAESEVKRPLASRSRCLRVVGRRSGAVEPGAESHRTTRHQPQRYGIPVLHSGWLPKRGFAHDALHFARVYVLHGQRRPCGEAPVHRAFRHERHKLLHDAALLDCDVHVSGPRKKTNVHAGMHDSEAYRFHLLANADL
jgi:hypothetical protein